jgi:hypothetical protein
MPVELRAVTDTFDLACPHCDAALLRIEPNRLFVVSGGYWAEDSDVVPVYDLVPEDALAHYCVLMSGTAACCGKPTIVITATLAPGEPDDEMRERFFFRNEDPGPETNFTALGGIRTWTVRRFESEHGPVLEHSFGPFAWADKSWIGPNGVS